MAQENLTRLMNKFVADMRELGRLLRQANRSIRELRARVKVLDGEHFNEPKPEEVEKFYRNYERADNLRQAIRLALHNINRLEQVPVDEEEAGG